MKLPKLSAPISVAAIAITAVLLAAYGSAGAVLLNCPQTISLKAAGAPFPWSDSYNPAATANFAEASYSCSNGTCTLKDLKIEGSSMNSLMLCGTSSYASTSIFHGDTVETTITSTQSGVATVSHISARRLGVCP